MKRSISKHREEMSNLDGSIEKGYKSLLFLVQFILKKGDLEWFAEKLLPKWLVRFGINDEEKKTRVLNEFQRVIDDYKKMQQSNGVHLELVARRSRNSIRCALAVFGALVTITSVKNLVINLVKSKKLDSSISKESFRNLGRIAASFGALLSSRPLTDNILSKVLPFHTKELSTFVTALVSFYFYPKDYSRDLLSIYMFVYGVESLQKYLFKEGKISTLKKKSSFFNSLTQTWVLIPVSFAELYHTYIIHPEFTPSLVKRLFDAQFKDIYDAKPVWYTKDWPSVSEINQVIRRSSVLKDRKVFSSIVGSEVTRITAIQPSPLHSNKILSITNPTEANVWKIILRFIPRKYGKFLMYLIPLYLIKDIITKKLTIRTFKENGKEYLLQLLKSISKLSLFTVLSTITAHLLTSQNINSHSPIKNFRLIGLIAGLWGVIYRGTANKSLLTYLLRITLLSVWRRHADLYPELNKYNVDLILNAAGWTTLVAFYDRGLKEHISPSRFINIAEWISTGGEDL